MSINVNTLAEMRDMGLALGMDGPSYLGEAVMGIQGKESIYK